MDIYKKKKLNDDFDEIDERLITGWYKYSGQQGEYFKSIINIKRGKMYFIVNIVICANSLANKLSEIPAKAIYSLVGDLNGIKGISGSSPLNYIFACI